MDLRNLIYRTGIFLIRTLLLKLLPETNVSDYESFVLPDQNQLFDFIIVGGGAAGSVLAARLTEVESWNVLVLESGGPPPPEFYVPALDKFVHVQSVANWNYKLVPQKYSGYGYAGRTTTYPCGRTLGGGSTINSMVYSRGNKKDYDDWAAMGNPGWDYESLLPYFKKSEDFEKWNYSNSKYRGKGGPMRVSTIPWGTPLKETFLKAGLELGYPSVDPILESQIGFSNSDMTIRNGIRESTADAFLRPNLKRRNLNVLTRSHVVKILFDENKKAIGVEYLHNGKKRAAFAKREVILSAGTIETPKLLMLSGVGPKKHLKKHYIPIVEDIPGIGQNFHDHHQLLSLAWSVNPGHAMSLSILLNPDNFLNYIKYRKGPLSSSLAHDGNSWLRVTPGDPEVPDAQFTLISFHAGMDNGILSLGVLGYEPKLFEKYFRKLYGKEGFLISPVLLEVKSRGSITLNSSNPLDQANVDPNYFSHPDDVDVMVKVIRFALRIGNTKAFKYHGAKFNDVPLPVCKHLALDSDEYWKCYARSLVSTGYHPVGTCKMAPAHDKMGVVDSQLRVRRLKGLRVMDSSIMPVVPRGNTNAMAVMIGEKGADMIKQDWGVRIL